MTSAWAFIILVGVLALLAGYAAHCGQVAQDAQGERKQAEQANAALHAQVAELRRYLDKLNYHNSNLMVENYELHSMINQAYKRGFIPRPMKQGREN